MKTSDYNRPNRAFDLEFGAEDYLFVLLLAAAVVQVITDSLRTLFPILH
jgi:hypothetical protein